MDELENLLGMVKKQDTARRDALYESATAGGDDQEEEAAAEPPPDYSNDTFGREDDDDVKVCFDFQKGKCNRGDGCKFAHIEDVSDRPSNTKQAVDLSNQSLTAALTLEPRVSVESSGTATEADLNKLFREEFPRANFRMAREALSDEEDESKGLESMLAAEQRRIREKDEDQPAKKGKSMGYGSLLLANAEQAKDFIFRFNGFPFMGCDLIVVPSNVATRGSTRRRSGKLTKHQRKMVNMRNAEKRRTQSERDEYAAAIAARSRPAAPPVEAAATTGVEKRRRPTWGSAGLLKKKKSTLFAPAPEALPSKAAPAPPAAVGAFGAYGSSSSSEEEEEAEAPSAPAKEEAETATKPAAGKNNLAAEAMRAKLLGDTAKYEELMAQMK